MSCRGSNPPHPDVGVLWVYLEGLGGDLDINRLEACVGQAGPLTALRTLRLFRAGC